MNVSYSMRLAQASTAALLAVALTGCPQSSPSASRPAEGENAHGEHGQKPATLPATYQAIAETSEKIEAAFKAGTPEEAHNPLHEIAHLIKKLPDMAAKAGVQATDEVQQATDQLMDAYGKLDGGMHGGEKVGWDDVQPEIDEAMQKFKGWLPEEGVGVGPQHDGVDHPPHAEEPSE